MRTVIRPKKERKTIVMKIKTGIDLELRTLLRDELNKLKEYFEMFDHMTQDEKNELREWMAHGKSVNSNPHLLYGENGCLMDFISASRMAEEMAADPSSYQYAHEDEEMGILSDAEPF